MDNNHSKGIAIVGANGFIGKALNGYLQAKDIATTSFTSADSLIIDSQLSENLSQSSHIIWCASRVNPVSATQDPLLVEREIQEWSSFLDAVDKIGTSKPTIIFLSSGGCTYSWSDIPFNENGIAEGTNNYGKLKVVMEQKLLLRDIPSIILRVANVYGPNQPLGRGQGVIAEWLYALSKNKNLDVYGSTDSFRDYIYLEDLCDAIFNCLKLNASKNIYNIGSGTAINLEEVLNTISRFSSEALNVRRFESRTSDRSGYYLDIGLFKSKTGWEPKNTLETGIAKMLGLTNDQ